MKGSVNRQTDRQTDTDTASRDRDRDKDLEDASSDSVNNLEHVAVAPEPLHSAENADKDGSIKHALPQSGRPLYFDRNLHTLMRRAAIHLPSACVSIRQRIAVSNCHPHPHTSCRGAPVITS